MGWRGTLRTLGAISREAERNSNRRARERAKGIALSEKIEAREQAADAVSEFEEYVKKLITLHQSCSQSINWQSQAATPAPTQPLLGTKAESAAQSRLDKFKPSWLDKLFGSTEKKLKKLSNALAAAKTEDQQRFQKELAKFEEDSADHKDQVNFAKRILAKDPKAFLEAIKLYEPLHAVGLLGENLLIQVESPDLIIIDLSVHGEEVIPKDRPKLLASGRASVKAIPKGEYNRLYQDHVCSASLRVTREILALIPVDAVQVNAVDDLVDSATGHLKQSAILSYLAPRSTIEKLNYHSIDPSDAMKNFLHQMSFSPTAGFKPIEQLKPSRFEPNSLT
jgi:hypothetical protein